MPNAEHLNGIINEALRPHLPSLFGGLHTIPPQGITVDGVFVPGGVDRCVPLYTRWHDASTGTFGMLLAYGFFFLLVFFFFFFGIVSERVVPHPQTI